jgi:Ni,Fe-hydrogenase maturation factor
VFCFELDDLPKQSIGHLASAHDTSLQDAVEVGRRLGVCLPERISIVAVETAINYDFCEILSPQIESAIPVAVSQVLTLLAGITH